MMTCLGTEHTSVRNTGETGWQKTAFQSGPHLDAWNHEDARERARENEDSTWMYSCLNN